MIVFRQDSGFVFQRVTRIEEGRIMKKRISLGYKTFLLGAVLILSLLAAASILLRESPKAFGGNFGPQMGQQGGRYQISGCNANSAWVIDTAMGDVYMIYSSGKWKEVGSIMDETKRIRR
jgi:hypothetical protein